MIRIKALPMSFYKELFSAARGATATLFEIRVGVDVSIHAPAWGATDCKCGGPSIERFQSMLPRGERHPP